MPKNLRVITGNARNKPIPDVPEPPEVKPQAVPPPPEQLSVAARPHWQSFGEQLAKMRVLSEADLGALALLAETYAIYWEAMEGVRQFGIMAVTPNKYIVRSEYLNTAFKAMNQCMRILAEFGLTPSSRMKLRAE